MARKGATPAQPVLRRKKVKVTLSLSQCSVGHFKHAAAREKVSYQRVIGALVDAYADKHRKE